MKNSLIIIAAFLIVMFATFKITSTIQKNKANINMAVLVSQNKLLHDQEAGFKRTIEISTAQNKALQSKIVESDAIILVERQKRHSDNAKYQDSIKSLSTLSNNEQMAIFLNNSYPVTQFGDSTHFITPIVLVKKANVIAIENKYNKYQVQSLMRENKELSDNIGRLVETVNNDSIASRAMFGRLSLSKEVENNLSDQVKAERKLYRVERRKRVVSQIAGVVELVVIGWLVIR